MNNSMDKEVIWRVATTLRIYLDEHASISKDRPYAYNELGMLVNNIDEFIQFLNTYEQTFMDWMTRSVNEDSYYHYSTEHYGIRAGRKNPECYKNVLKLLRIVTSERMIFDYIYDEYLIMEDAKRVSYEMQTRDSRTCHKCETRFETYQGMHRHESRCKGDESLTFIQKLQHPAYRGDYHPKETFATTSTW
jgi:hypothetical protein